MKTQEHRTQREDSYGKMEAEIGVTLPQATECLGSPESGTTKEGSTSGNFGEKMPQLVASFWTSNLQNCERYISVG